MATSLRSSVDTVLADAGRAFGTFVGLLWLCLLTGLLVDRATALTSYRPAGPVELASAGAFIAAALGTTWLEDGGYERLGADPDAGPTFALLAIAFVPLALLPTRYALGVLFGTTAPDPLFAAATTLIAGWLAFYGGLERLDLESADFVRVIGSVLALGAAAVAIVRLAAAPWLTDDVVVATVAIAVQAAACWLGLGVAREAP